MDINNLKDLLTKKIEENGYQLITFNYSKETLSLVVDRVEEINLNDIVDLTHVINDYLDVLDPIENPYSLDISSLGAEKPLKIEQLSLYINKYVHVHLINPIFGENIYEGDLISIDDSNIVIRIKIKTRIKDIVIEKNNIANIRLAIKF